MTQSGIVVGGRIPFETCGVEQLVCKRACMRDVLHGATPQQLEKDELCPFLHTHSLTQTKTRLSLLIFMPHWLPSKWEPAWTVGGSETACSLIKDRLITGASQPGFCAADKRIILERKEEIVVVPGRLGLLLDWAGRKYSPFPSILCSLSASLKNGPCNQNIQYGSSLSFSQRKPA